jgi:hypothetical protein
VRKVPLGPVFSAVSPFLVSGDGTGWLVTQLPALLMPGSVQGPVEAANWIELRLFDAATSLSRPWAWMTSGQ